MFKRNTSFILILLLAACGNDHAQPITRPPQSGTVRIPVYLPQNVGDTFTYRGTMHYSCSIWEEMYDTTYQEIAKIIRFNNDSFAFVSSKVIHKPYENAVDMFLTDVWLVYDIRKDTFYDDGDTTSGYGSYYYLHFGVNDSIERYSKSIVDNAGRRETSSFKGRRIK